LFYTPTRVLTKVRAKLFIFGFTLLPPTIPSWMSLDVKVTRVCDRPLDWLEGTRDDGGTGRALDFERRFGASFGIAALLGVDERRRGGE
jgi:hypothetical protein